MARTILPIVGGIVGSFFGAPQLGFAIGSLIGNAVDPQRIKGPRIGDANVQTSQEGAPRPIVYGTAAVMGNLVDRGPLNKVITEERQGKGGGPVVETESLFMTFAIRICEGEIGGVTRIWEDERLVYDVREESEILGDSERYAQGFKLYLGSEDQLPDPDLEAIHGVGNTPAYRGTAYIVFREKNLTERRGSIPQFRFEVSRCPPPIPVVPKWLLKVGTYNEVPAFSNEIFRSVDGLTWTSTTPVGPGGSLEYANPGFAKNILFTSSGQPARCFSIDEGLTISPLYSDGPPVGSPGGRAVFFAGKWFRVGATQRLAVSTDNGITFTEATTDNNSRLIDIEVTASGRLVGVREGNSTYVSDDGGVTWTARPSLDSSSFPTGFISIIRIRRTGTLVASFIAGRPADPPNRGRLAYSRDDGETWNDTGFRFDVAQNELGTVIGLTEWGDGRVAAATQSGAIAISARADDGSAFTLAPFTFPTRVNSLSGDVEKLIACGTEGQLWVTYNGTDWIQLSTAYGDAEIAWVTPVP